MRICILSGLFFCLALLFPAFSHSDDKKINPLDERHFKKVKEKAGITVLCRYIPEDHALEFKSWVISDCAFETGVEVMKDPEAYHEWYGMTEKLYVIKTISENKYLMHFIVDLPYMPDCDIVVEVSIKWDYQNGIGIAEIKSVDSSYRPDKDLHRMKKMNGSFTITREGPNLTKCVYRMYISLGGFFDALPDWALRLIGKRQPFDTNFNLTRQVKKPLYVERAKKIKDLNYSSDRLNLKY